MIPSKVAISLERGFLRFLCVINLFKMYCIIENDLSLYQKNSYTFWEIYLIAFFHCLLAKWDGETRCVLGLTVIGTHIFAPDPEVD